MCHAETRSFFSSSVECSRGCARRCQTETRQLASAVSRAGVLPGQVVSVLVPNVPVAITCHFAIPGMGATLHMINTRLDARAVAFQASAESGVDVTRLRRGAYSCFACLSGYLIGQRRGAVLIAINDQRGEGCFQAA